jgi:hypothetical protein
MNYTSYFKTPEPFVKKVKKFIHEPEHIILYGPENSGKYTQALHIINQFSKSNLKYSRKIELEINSEKYYFNISDIHFEIDFELLGTNETTIWFEFILAITSIIDIQGKSILLCKNAHCMKDELLYIFHTFMRDPNLKLILCTKNVSYFPTQIKDKCLIFNLKQMKHIQSYSQQYKLYCDQIIEFINIQNNDLFLLRELLYSLMTYNCDIHTCLYYIYGELIKHKYLDVAHLKNSFKNSIDILKHYNTNYRPIYHLELFILELHALRHTSIK